MFLNGILYFREVGTFLYIIYTSFKDTKETKQFKVTWPDYTFLQKIIHRDALCKSTYRNNKYTYVFIKPHI